MVNSEGSRRSPQQPVGVRTLQVLTLPEFDSATQWTRRQLRALKLIRCDIRPRSFGRSNSRNGRGMIDCANQPFSVSGKTRARLRLFGSKFPRQFPRLAFQTRTV